MKVHCKADERHAIYFYLITAVFFFVGELGHLIGAFTLATGLGCHASAYTYVQG